MLFQYKLFFLAPMGLVVVAIGLFVPAFFLRWPAVLQESALAITCFGMAMFSTEVKTSQFMRATSHIERAWYVLHWLVFLVLAGIFKADWVRLQDARQRSGMLRNKFTGSLLDAKCSSDEDTTNIHRELFESGNLHEVEVAVNTLLRVNFLTPELVSAADEVGEIGDNSICPRAGPLLALNLWLFPSMEALFFPFFEGLLIEQILLILTVIEGICWLLVFLYSPPDRRVFSIYVVQLWIGAHCAVVGLQFVLPTSMISEMLLWYPRFGAFFLGPFCLFILIAGPIRVARVPVVGHSLVRRSLGGRTCSRRYDCKESEASKRESLPGMARVWSET